MRLVAFLQLYNELEVGNLVRCLNNCKQWADDIYIYDDCSDDGSQEVYKQYTEESNIIHGSTREFNAEMFHKQQLLALVLKTNPDWIGWIDGDAVICSGIIKDAKGYLKMVEEKGHDASFLHNLNLWRHPAFYRVDNKYNGLWHVVFWKNSGKLFYNPERRLHRRQYPMGIVNEFKPSPDLPLMHFGFSSKMQIVRKYLTYKSYGQSGWSLDRLIDENGLALNKVPKEWYPEEDIPPDYDTVEPLQPIGYDEYKRFNSWEEFKTSSEYQELTK